MLRSPSDRGYTASTFQPPGWCSLDGGRGTPEKNANMTAACVYPTGWPCSYTPVPPTSSAIPLVLPLGPSSQSLCRLPLPWTGYAWPPIAPILPAPVVVSPTTGLQFPMPPPVGLEQASALSVPSAAHMHHPRMHMPMVGAPVAAPPMPLATQPEPYRFPGAGSEVTSEGTAESTELRTPELRVGQAGTDGHEKVEEEDDGDVDVEGSSTCTNTGNESCSRPLATQEAQQSLDRSPQPRRYILTASLPPKPISEPQSTALNSPNVQRGTFGLPVPIHLSPSGQHSSSMQHNSSGLGSGRGMRRPLLPDIAPSNVQSQVRLAFNVTRGQGSPEQGCSVCGTLACGSRSASRGPDNPPRRQYFSCKVARRRLLEWIELHKDHPYPTKSQRAQLLKETGMNRVQLQNWLGNHRRRLKAQKSDHAEVNSPSSESS